LNADLQQALDALRQKLRDEFEHDQNLAISRIIARSELELAAVRDSIASAFRCHRDLVIERLEAEHATQLSTIKKSVWCRNCEIEAKYFCCWATSYCSVTCQKEHWENGHQAKCQRGSTVATM
jgi:hypothetical protein